MARRALLLHMTDNCVVAVEDIDANEQVVFERGNIVALSRVALGHKLAIRPIAKGGKVVKYGASIGSATRDIACGEHIHSHNLKSDYIAGFHFEDSGTDEAGNKP